MPVFVLWCAIMLLCCLPRRRQAVAAPERPLCKFVCLPLPSKQRETAAAAEAPAAYRKKGSVHIADINTIYAVHVV